MSAKTAREQRAAARAQPPPSRRPTGQGALAGIPRSWLYGGLAMVVVAIVCALILATQLGAEEQTPPMAVSGEETVAMLDGVPQDGTSLGSPDAPAVLHVFADLQCPFCQQWDRNVLPVLVEDYVRSGKLRIVFQGLAFIGPDSEKALRTALVAGEQGRLWSVTGLFYRHQGGENDGWVTDQLIDAIGAAVPGLDGERMVADRRSDAVTEEIGLANGLAGSHRITSTPSFLIGAEGGELVRLEIDSLEPEPFRAAIDSALGR